MRRLRMPATILVLAIALAGCAKADAGSIAARQEIAAGDKLLASKDYDAALDRFAKAANECTSGPVHDEALAKATAAVTSEVDGKPLAEQVAAMKAFLGRIPDPILPLRAHNWLSDRLHDEAQRAIADAKTFSAGNQRLLAATAGTTAKKTTAKTTSAAKKTAAAKSASSKASTATASFAATRSATATVSVAASRTPAAAPAPPAPAYVFPSSAELREIAKTLPDLGQPPAMAQLYANLAEVRSAMDAGAKVRKGLPKAKPIARAQSRLLAAAQARLVKSLQSVDRLLASL